MLCRSLVVLVQGDGGQFQVSDWSEDTYLFGKVKQPLAELFLSPLGSDGENMVAVKSL